MPRRKSPPTEIVRLNKVLPRLELATALEMSGGEDEKALAKLLRSSGESSRMTISTLAMDIGLPYRRVVECYRDMKRLEGIVAVASRLPDVMAGVAADAESKSIICAACEGSGKIITYDAEGKPSEAKICIVCEGQCRVIKSGDPVARKQVLEIMELTGKAAAPVWAPGSNILMSGESLEDTMRSIRAKKEEPSNGDHRNPPTVEADQRTVEPDR